MTRMESRNYAKRLVAFEMDRQDARWGEQRHPDGTGPDIPWSLPRDMSTADLRDFIRHANDGLAAAGHPIWAGILLEEVFEALSETEPRLLRDELVQVAAVAMQWIADIDGRDR